MQTKAGFKLERLVVGQLSFGTDRAGVCQNRERWRPGIWFWFFDNDAVLVNFDFTLGILKPMVFDHRGSHRLPAYDWKIRVGEH